jgi:hypothetical protein
MMWHRVNRHHEFRSRRCLAAVSAARAWVALHLSIMIYHVSNLEIS